MVLHRPIETTVYYGCSSVPSRT